MKSILVLVEEHSCIESTLACAALLGRAFDSRIEGRPIAPDISDIVVADISIGATVFDARTRQMLTERASHQFEAGMAAAHYPRVPDGSGAVAVWTDEMTGDGAAGALGRVYDLTVVGRPGSGGHDPRQATFESALFESGRPVLIAPPRTPETVGDTVLIAWNRSSETARTVAFAMPLLRRARRVVVVTIQVSHVTGPSGALLAAALKRHGIDAESTTTEARSAANEGSAALAKAREIGADLVIKGGYTQSRLRQMIFGGATSHILAHSDLPVFMAH